MTAKQMGFSACMFPARNSATQGVDGPFLRHAAQSDDCPMVRSELNLASTLTGQITLQADQLPAAHAADWSNHTPGSSTDVFFTRLSP
jgi:hypothetical protein